MDIFHFTNSKTRLKILELFLSDTDKAYYLHEIRSKLSLSAGNIRRELLSFVSLGLFKRTEKGRLIYYKINKESPFFSMIKSLSQISPEELQKDITDQGSLWVTRKSPSDIEEEVYCQTRDVFGARLQSLMKHLEKEIGNDAYLVSAIAGEIGNNSFDHNLGSWPDIPGIYFARDEISKTIVLADRGQGILRTIRNVMPDIKNDKEALDVAFTMVISGRAPEQRGNGLKFVANVLRERKWALNFVSGRASLSIDTRGKMKIENSKKNVHGCFAVIKYKV